MHTTDLARIHEKAVADLAEIILAFARIDLVYLSELGDNPKLRIESVIDALKKSYPDDFSEPDRTEQAEVDYTRLLSSAVQSLIDAGLVTITVCCCKQTKGGYFFDTYMLSTDEDD